MMHAVKVALRDAATGKVTGLHCRFCVAFGREEKVGSKRKPASTVQGWNAPFRYDNIEKHLRDQHPSQWDVYNAVTSADKRDSFFAGGAPGGGKGLIFKSSIKAHFASDSLGAEDIEKNTVAKIVGEMMFNPEGDVNSDEEDNGSW
jgi:hypothetical protein